MPSHIKNKTERPRIEKLLAPYRQDLGEDFQRYRNHVYRTTTYAMHLLGNEEQHEALVETAFVYHDIALWTHKEMAYLEPSAALALRDNAQQQWGLEPQLLQDAIHWHHKITPFDGPNAEVVNACRKADWIDVSYGIIRHGISSRNIRKVRQAFPYLGFYNMLVASTKRNTGSYMLGTARVLRGILKW